jgi:hypothetical protein
MQLARWVVYFAVVAVPLLLVLLQSFSAAPLPQPDAFSGALPSATPPLPLRTFADSEPENIRETIVHLAAIAPAERLL